MSKVWLVTGSASGLGRDIAEAVLASGDRLLATARDPERLNDLVERYVEQVSTASLDVSDEVAAKAAVAKAVDVFGRLDVLVNNAGYGDTAPFEQVSSERFRALIETNFFGVVSMTRAAIPIMRHQKSGCILQISSVGGRLATPGSASYHAAKWAVGGFTEAVALEVASFGVKICALEPGGMRTNWGNRRLRMSRFFCRSMSRLSARWLGRLQRIGDMRRVTLQRSLRSSCISPPKSSSHLTCCSAATLCSMPELPRTSGSPTPRRGLRSASQLTLTAYRGGPL
jgi:NAD(P)-dependent dehydrogenase (short-subunit alcohol dehydrogenase family)